MNKVKVKFLKEYNAAKVGDIHELDENQVGYFIDKGIVDVVEKPKVTAKAEKKEDPCKTC